MLWIFLVGYQIYRDYPRWQSACVVRVTDGDTIKYTLDGLDTHLMKGRLWGIDAFESAQKPWGDISKKKLMQLLKIDETHLGDQCNTCLIKFIKKDKYDRNLIQIKKYKIDEVTINEKMLMSGWAIVYIFNDWIGSEKSRWKKMQEMAQISKKGIWKYSKKYWQIPARFRKSTLSRLEHHRDFDQKSSALEQKF